MIITREKRKPTLADVAKRAKVHPGTVSRVLNHRQGPIRVSQKTQDKILQIAKELNFYPDHAAQSLASAVTHIIGVYIYPEGPAGDGKIGSYQAEVINGIESYAYENGYDILFMGLSKPEDDIERCKKQLYQRRVDGLILLSDPERAETVKLLVETAKPVVAVDTYAENVGTICINIDNIKGAKLATEHLISLGHKKIGYIGSLRSPEGIEEALRKQGYLETIKKLGFGYSEKYVVNGNNCEGAIPRIGNWCFADGYNGIKDLLNRDSEVTACLCMNDIVAAGALSALHDIGIKVPEQFSVIGFDDSIIARYTYPALTSVRHNLQQMGRWSAESLIEMIENKTRPGKTEVRYVDVELVIRRSTSRVNY